MPSSLLRDSCALHPLLISHPARLLDFMRQADDKGLINLAAGIPSSDILPLRELQKAAAQSFKKSQEKIFGYHVPEGSTELREQIAHRLRNRSTQVQAKDLMITSGCTQALHLMIQTWIKPGDIVACEAPAYYGMLELLASRQARVLPLPVHPSKGLELASLKKYLKRWKPTCLIVCSSLSNPSGTTIPESDRQEFVAICRKLKVRILEDDIYAELLDTGAPKPLRAYDDGSLVSYVSSFSKSVSPGMRMGVAIPGNSFEEVANLKCQQDIHSSHISEGILQHFMSRGALDHHLSKLRPFYKKRREIAYKALDKYFPEGTHYTRPLGGFMLWVKLPKKINLATLREKSLQHGVSFSIGNAFFVQQPNESYMRLNCAKASEKQLREGISIIGNLLKKAGT